jgi:hypothetical protein
VPNVFPKWTNQIPVIVTFVLPVVALGVVLGIWYFFSPKFTDVGYAPKQPVPFSHKLHAGDLGMDCRYCHNTVERSPYAAVPPTETCMGCHQLVLPDSPRLTLVRESFATDRPIEWVRVHMLPDYAYFDHHVHVAAGVSCVSCHGRVDQMEVVHQSQPLSMGWCLDCHRNPIPHLRPVDQVTNLAWDAAQANYDPAFDPNRKRKPTPPVHCSGCHQ